MNRTHIHFAKGEQVVQASSSGEVASKQAVSGIRSNAEVLLYVDIFAAMRETELRELLTAGMSTSGSSGSASCGLKFEESANSVVLCSGPVPLEFVTKVVDAKTGVELEKNDVVSSAGRGCGNEQENQLHTTAREMNIITRSNKRVAPAPGGTGDHEGDDETGASSCLSLGGSRFPELKKAKSGQN